MLKLKATDINAAGRGLRRKIQLTTNRNDLIGEFMFARDRATSVQNSASETALDAVPFGDPVFNSNHVSNVGVETHFDTRLLVKPAMTIMAFLRFGASGGGEVIIGSSPVATNRFFIQRVGNPISFFTGPTSNATAFSVDPSISRDEFLCSCYTVDSLVNPTLTGSNFNNGQLAGAIQTFNTSGTRALNDRTMHVGSLGVIEASGKIDFAGLLVWERVLSEAERLAAYQEAFAVFSDFGLTV